MCGLVAIGYEAPPSGRIDPNAGHPDRFVKGALYYCLAAGVPFEAAGIGIVGLSPIHRD
jgi:hypothetical protein